MTGDFLFEAIGDVKDSYILSALATRERARPRRISRILLIAAALAALLLAGCVAYVLSIGNLVIRTEPDPLSTKQSEQVRSVISLQGYAGSPGYQAAKEWYEFQQTYVYPQDEPEIPMEQRLDYLSYGCFYQEEIDKVDEICQTNGLKLLGHPYSEETAAQALEALGLTGLVLPEAPVQASYFDNGFYYYACGTFYASFNLTFTGEDASWSTPLRLGMRYVKKDYFDGVYSYLGDLDSYEEWVYTTGQGVEALMALSHESNDALIIAEQEDAFLTVQMDDVVAGDRELGLQQLSREDLETVADCLNLQLRPGAVDVEAAEARENALREEALQNQAEWEAELKNRDYAYRMQFIADNSEDLSQVEYALTDLDGDGVRELFLDAPEFSALYVTNQEGTAVNPLLNSGLPQKLQVLEDGLLLRTETDGSIVTRQLIRLRGTDAEYLDFVQYNPAQEAPYTRITLLVNGEEISPFLTSQTSGGTYQSTPITQEAFEAVGREYTPEELSTVPFQDYLRSIDHIRIQDTWEGYLKDALDAGILSQDACYLRSDLDGDGQDELILGDTPEAANQILGLKDGTVVYLLRRSDLHLCQDGLIMELDAGDSYEVRTYYRLDQYQAVEVEQIAWSAFENPENPWSRRGQDGQTQLLTQEEYLAALAEHPVSETSLSPIPEGLS